MVSNSTTTGDSTDSLGKPILGAREQVTVIGEYDRVEADARIDTGATRTQVDRELACAIGAGPLVGAATFRGSNGATERLIVEVEVTIAGNTHAVEASVADRSHLATDVRLGQDVLESYLVDISR